MIWAVAAWGAGGLVFFRQFVFSGFDRVFGDMGDGRLIVYLHEHLYHVVRGLAPLTSPAMFYPKSGVLGYSDAFLLDVPLYAPLRLLGCDPFLSYQLTWVALSLIGFVSFTALLVRFAGVRRSVALVGSALFVFPNMLMNAAGAGHPQLFAVYFTPTAALLFLEGLRGIDRLSVRSFSAMFFFGMLDALTFSTGYYVAWCFNFLVILAILIASAARPSALRALAHRYPITGVLRLFSVCMCGFAIGMIPFVAIYGPVLREFHGHARSFAEYLMSAPRIYEFLINVGENNMIWGSVLKASHILTPDHIHPSEYTFAVTPFLLVSAMITAFAAWRRRILGGVDDIAVRTGILGSVAAVALMFLITAGFNDWSAFKVVAAIIPGASAIRVGGRFGVVASGFLVAAAAIGIDRGLRSLSFPRRLLLYALMVVCLLEQVNFVSPANISRSEELQRLAVVPSPPETCRCFFIAPQADRPLIAQQIDAMLISQMTGTPTLNGSSGVLPQGWDLGEVGDRAYSLRAWQWAYLYGIAEGLFEYNVAERQWLAVEPPWITYSWGTKLDFSTQSPNLKPFMIQGWDGPEDWGAWSVGVKAVVGFIAPKPTEDMILELGDFRIYAGQPVDVVVNGEAVYHFSNFDSAKSISISVTKAILAKKSPIIIEFLTPQSTTPLSASNGINPDTKLLGVALRTLALMPESQYEVAEPQQPAVEPTWITYSWGTRLDFSTQSPNPKPFMIQGWDGPGDWGAWSVGVKAVVGFVAPQPTEDMVLELGGFRAFAGQPVDVVVNGEAVCHFSNLDSAKSISIPVTKAILAKKSPIIIEFLTPQSVSPLSASHGINPDPRPLGVGLRTLALMRESEYKVAEQQWPAVEPTWITYSWGTKLDFSTQSPNPKPFMIQGWDGPGDWGAWSMGVKAVVGFVAPQPTEDMVLELGDFRAFAGQPVDVVVNGEAVYHFSNFDLAKSISFPVTKAILAKKSPIIIEFLTPQSTSPLSASHGVIPDTRLLGVGLRTLTLMPESEYKVAEQQWLPVEPPLIIYSWGIKLDFSTQSPDPKPFMIQGWDGPGDWGAWSMGVKAVVEFVTPPPTEDMVLELGDFRAFAKQPVDVVVNGEAVYHFSNFDSAKSVSIPVTKAILAKKSPIIVEFLTPQSVSSLSASHGVNSDTRLLGVGLRTLTLMPESEYKVVEQQRLAVEPTWITYSWGRKLDFSTQSPNPKPFMIQGWGGPGDWGAWSVGVKAVVGFIAPQPTEDMILELGDFRAFAGQPVDVVVNGEAVYHFSNFDSAKTISIPVTKAILAKKSPIIIEFLTPQSTSPLSASHGVIPDTRLLGVGLRTLTLMPKKEDLDP
jgi:hypothetical protein